MEVNKTWLLITKEELLSPQNEVARIVREKDLNALRGLGGVDGILPLLRSQLDEALVDGQNPQLWNTTDESPISRKKLLMLLVEGLPSVYGFSPLTLSQVFVRHRILEGRSQMWVARGRFHTHYGLVVAFASVGNYYRERKLVRKNLLVRSKLIVDVERGSGEPTPVNISSVVVGTIVHLKEGDRVPTDGLFIDQGVELMLDEVLNPKINCEQNPFMLSGSKFIVGRGRMIVTSIGTKTAFAEMLSLATHQNPNEKKLLQALMDKPYACMDYLAVCVSLLIALVVLIRLLFFTQHDDYNDRPELKGEVSMKLMMRIFEKIFLKPQGRVSTLASVLAAAVIGIQHGILRLQLPFANGRRMWSKIRQILGIYQLVSPWDS